MKPAFVLSIFVIGILLLYMLSIAVIFLTGGVGNNTRLIFNKKEWYYNMGYFYSGYGQMINKGDRPYWYNKIISPIVRPGIRAINFLTTKTCQENDKNVNEIKTLVIPQITESYDSIEINWYAVSLPIRIKYWVIIRGDNDVKLFCVTQGDEFISYEKMMEM